MTEPEYNLPILNREPDRFSISADYEPDGTCRNITIYFNDDRTSIEDIAAAIRVAFNPRTLPEHRFQVPSDIRTINGKNWFGNE